METMESDIRKEITPERSCCASCAHCANEEETEKSRVAAPQIAAVLGVVLFIAGIIGRFTGAVQLALYLTSYALIGYDVVIRALKGIVKGEIFDENFLMMIATVGAFAIGEYPEGVAVMLFYKIGETLQDMAVNRSRRSINKLMDIRPDTAMIIDNGKRMSVRAESVVIDAIVAVAPGERIPLDGVVLQGKSSVDTSHLTGESIPREISEGDTALSGSINMTGELTIKVTRAFADSTVSKIIKLTRDAAAAKSPTENLISRFARVYTPIVVFAALALAVIPPLFTAGVDASVWIHRALVFLVVSCPCALVISVPLTTFAGIGAAARSGILVKGSNYLNVLADIETVVFDKTGTLTKGMFEVSDINPANGFTRESLLELAAYAESGSNHPIAASVLKAYGGDISYERVSDYREAAGFGVSAVVDGKVVLAGNDNHMKVNAVGYDKPASSGTIVHVAVENAIEKRYAGYIIVSDVIKPTSREALAELRGAGIKRFAMLTGDSSSVGERVADELGIDDVYSELLPHEKVGKVEELLINQRNKRGKLAFVGDGINDAPSLARADVGVAMGGIGQDTAIEAADAVIMNDDLSRLTDAVQIARRTRSIVWQNIIFALGVKAVILVLGAMGMASMWVAVFGDVGVTLIAVLNALRAMTHKR
ncbi:cadmium-translocating P-type ATPase [Clostridia bacterium]|nr:cadmium-translocating P-type ATPase [Clostridia bacterium]